MSITKGVVLTTVNTSTGNQTFTDSSFGGGTPTGAIFIYSINTSTSNNIDDYSYSVGFCDATSERCCVVTGESGQGTTDTSRGTSDGDVVLQYTPGTTTEIAAATFVSFGTNSVTINWTNAPGSAYYMKVILFGGEACDVGGLAPNATQNSGTTESVLSGATPRAIFFMSNNQGANTTASQTKMGFGMAALNSSTINQGCHNHHDRNGQATSQILTIGYINK
jgi:hypothetical protein